MNVTTTAHGYPRPWRARPSGAGLLGALALGLGLTACGGQYGAEEPQALASARLIAPLVADDGSLLPADPRAVPADPGAQTRRRQYATDDQAEHLGRALQGDVIEVNVDCCGHEARELAVQVTYGLQAAHDLSDDAPVFVRGADLRTAALVADELADAGLSRVFLVTR